MQHRLTAEQRNEVGPLYAAGLSSETIAARFGVTPKAIRGLMERRGIARRDRRECLISRPIDNTVFDEATPAARYWAGFLMADGNVHAKTERSSLVQLGLAEADLGHVEKFRSFIGSGHKISLCGGKAQLTVCSNDLAAALVRYGIVPDKTFTAEAPAFLSEDRDFWRGAIDGDGWISSARVPLPNNPARMQIQLGLIGSQPLVHQFAAYVKSLGVRSWAKPRERKPRVWQYSIADLAAVSVIRYLYSDANVFLDRKMERARKVLSATDHRAVVLKEG